MNNYIFASFNFNKLRELQKSFPQFKLLGLNTIGFYKEIKEEGLTLEENALIKARTIFEQYNRPCISDDTGLEVEYLDGRPGVLSARYAGQQGNSILNVKKLLEDMNEVINRRARFRTIICLKDDQKELLFEGVIKGTITTLPKGNNGFGYDPVFIPEGQKITFAEMSIEQKNQFSHRVIAMNKLINFINSGVCLK